MARGDSPARKAASRFRKRAANRRTELAAADPTVQEVLSGPIPAALIEGWRSGADPAAQAASLRARGFTIHGRPVQAADVARMAANARKGGLFDPPRPPRKRGSR